MLKETSHKRFYTSDDVVDTPVYPAAAQSEADVFGALKSNDCSDVCASAHHPRNLIYVHSHNATSICAPAHRLLFTSMNGTMDTGSSLGLRQILLPNFSVLQRDAKN
jgi:hypothetical protein